MAMSEIPVAAPLRDLSLSSALKPAVADERHLMSELLDAMERGNAGEERAVLRALRERDITRAAKGDWYAAMRIRKRPAVNDWSMTMTDGVVTMRHPTLGVVISHGRDDARRLLTACLRIMAERPGAANLPGANARSKRLDIDPLDWFRALREGIEAHKRPY